MEDRIQKSKFRQVRQYTIETADGTQLEELIYLPDNPPRGCVICIHGGGWRSGSCQTLAAQAAYFAAIGAVGASISYRLLSEKTDVRDALGDCIAAVEFVRGFIRKKYGELPVVALGESAGGYFAAALGCKALMREICSTARIVEFVVDLNGIVDLTGKWGYGIHDQNCLLHQKFSPIFRITEGDAPVLILHGDSDATVSLEESIAYCAALNAQGVACDLRILEGVAHAFFYLITSMITNTWPPFWNLSVPI